MRHLTIPDSYIIESVGFSREGYKGLSHGAMEVVFKSAPDVVYRYENVKQSAFVTIVAGDSPGKTFHELFRETKHPFTKSMRSKPISG
jgi:hypothetical protein